MIPGRREGGALAKAEGFSGTVSGRRRDNGQSTDRLVHQTFRSYTEHSRRQKD